MKSKKIMNILMISLSSELGGGTKHMFMLGENLKSDFKIYYAIPKNNIFLKYLYLNNYIEIAERKINLKDIIKLKNFIKINSIDIVHAHGKGAGVLARIVNLFIKKPLIYTFHGIHLKCHSFQGRLFYIIYEKLFGWIDSMKIFVSESEKNYAKKEKIYLGKKSLIINNGVQNRFIKKSYNIYKNEDNIFKFSGIKVISICRFVSQKNIEDILKIASKLSNIRFYIIGDGPLFRELSDLILEKNIINIFLLGQKKEVFKYLYAADIYLSTSLYEGLPISILEAMSIGLPVVASNVIGNCDTIVHEVSGYLYDLNDINMAINFISKLSKSFKLRKNLGEGAFERQRKFFSHQLMIKNYTNLYKNVILVN